MDYADFILPFLMHPAGHLTYGNQASGGAKLDATHLTEKWRGPVRAYREPSSEEIASGKAQIRKTRDGADSLMVPIYDEKSQVEFGGAGFKAQDEFGRAKNSESYDLGSALQKGLYLAGIHKLSNATEGDIKQMSHNSGNKFVAPMVALSAADDLRRGLGGNKDWRVNFTTIDGAPGLVYKRGFKKIPFLEDK